MAKIKKRGVSGQAKNFITRTQAVRKLQISLPDFRRLCIFKGIYPREPRNKKKASKSSTPSTTFYYTKDIQYLLHEPLLKKFRDHRALAKKIARSLGRGEVGDAARFEKNRTPKITLDHIIKERYPTFVDALRDLDDALSLMFLFANLPSTSTVPPKTIALCQRLCLEFEHYLITTNSLRKSFLSIKGIYYQATIQGQDILWLVPYKFVQRVTGDVDFRIMGTFVEFYTTLLGFINFRLYTSIGLVYPPKFNANSDERGGELGAITLEVKDIDNARPNKEMMNSHANGTNGQGIGSEDLQRRIDSISQLPSPESDCEQQQQEEQNEQYNDTIDTFEPTEKGADVLLQPQISGAEASQLFAPFSFFLSRETPRQPLEFILRAFGCKRVAWDAVLGEGAFTHNEADPTITHQVVDRPPLSSLSLPETLSGDSDTDAVAAQTVRPGSRIPGRTYVQPQWVWDCVNEGKLLRPDLYAPGVTLPPHLSPWVKPAKGAYNPSLPLVEQEREGEAEEAENTENSEEFQEVDGEEDALEKEAPITVAKEITTTIDITPLLAKSLADDENDMDVANSDQGDDERDKLNDDYFGGFDDDEVVGLEDDAETARTQHQNELEAEALGLTYSEAANGNGALLKSILKNSTGQEARKRATKRRREEEEELERRKMMMGRKKRKMLDKMLYSNRAKDDAAEKLRSKRRKIEKAKA